MSNSSSNPQEPNKNPDDKFDPIEALTLAKKLFGNSQLINWLSRNVIFGNLLIALFTGYSGYSLIHPLFGESNQKYVVANQYEYCKNFSKLKDPKIKILDGKAGALFICKYEDPGNEKQIYMRLQPVSDEFVKEDKIDLTQAWAEETGQCDNRSSDNQVTTISPQKAIVDEEAHVSDHSVKKEDLLFGCKVLASDGQKIGENHYIRLQFIPESSLTYMAYEEQRIIKSDFAEVCENEDHYLDKLKRQNITKESHHINPLGVEYRGDAAENKSVYPVFRWKCVFQTKLKEQEDSKDEVKYAGDTYSTIYTGISMDEFYCQTHFTSKKLTKATYHDYNDPNSWYCTTPDPKE